jgi:excinuclease UvrABC helicase subunit UvrB
MARAIEESTRRRQMQVEYNMDSRNHAGFDSRRLLTTSWPPHMKETTLPCLLQQKKRLLYLDSESIEKQIKRLEKKMKEAAKKMEFEEAARWARRDQGPGGTSNSQHWGES